VVNSEQLSPRNVPQSGRARRIKGKFMAAPKNDKYKDYARYAAHCLDIVPVTRDQDTRAINREMAAEWLRLAEAALHPLRRM